MNLSIYFIFSHNCCALSPWVTGKGPKSSQEFTVTMKKPANPTADSKSHSRSDSNSKYDSKYDSKNDPTKQVERRITPVSTQVAKLPGGTGILLPKFLALVVPEGLVCTWSAHKLQILAAEVQGS